MFDMNNPRAIRFRTNYLYLLSVLLLSLFIISCSSSSTGSDDMDDGGGDSNREPTFTNVQSILSGSCGGSGCHIGETTSGVRLDSYTNVIESEGIQYGEKVVQPNDAAGSPLVDKIEEDPQFGVRMPRGRSPLPQADIDLIKMWINQGAMNN